jgi:hypothetical protein
MLPPHAVVHLINSALPVLRCRRHLWLSTSTDLNVDAGRDLRDLDAHIPLINGCTGLDKGTRALGLAKDLQEGVLFL